MFNLLSAINILDPGPRDGLLKGQVAGCVFEARLARGPVSYGLDPDTLYKGYGRIVRLVVYREVGHAGMTVKVAAFDRGWMYGRLRHLAVIRRVVDYLERRAGALA